ncbi:MAG: PKD domain-containing protein, partial [Cyanobacteria bacterium P01_G01_bin.38]
MTGAAVQSLGYDGTKKDFAVWEKVALYLNGKLISGIEPGTTVDTPIALITASPTTGNGPLLVSFDGSGSTDPNGDVLTYLWDLGNGITKTGATIDHEFTEFGDQIVTLTVSDPSGNRDRDTITITVSDPNQPPLASFTVDADTAIAQATITFDASSSSDPNNDTLTYTWDFGNGDTATGITTSYSFNVIGTFTVQLTVSDGKLDNSVTKTITITDGNPIASITADATSGIAPLSVNFDATGSLDPQGNVLSYAWDFEDT